MTKVHLPSHWPLTFKELKRKKGWREAHVICDRADKEAFDAVIETCKRHKEPFLFHWRDESFTGYAWQIGYYQNSRTHDLFVVGVPPVKDAQQLGIPT